MLEQLPGSGIKRLLAIGVGCQTQALRAVQDSLGLEELYVLGMPCVDNVSREGLQTFLESTSRSPETVVHYSSCRTSAFTSATATAAPRRFPSLGWIPQAQRCLAPSCLSCFDYVNACADLVVGYMGAPFQWQWLVVRNQRGQKLLDLVEAELKTQPVMSSGQRAQAVQQGIDAYDKALRLPRWLAKWSVWWCSE